MKDKPSSLKNPNVRHARLKMLNATHIKPLTEFAQSIQDRKGPGYFVPYFDPLDGGVEANLLFVQKAPGVKTKSTCFVSRNNPDIAAKYMFELLYEVGLKRKDTVLWNTVPWCIEGDPSEDTIKEGSDFLNRLIGLLPKLKVIMFQGNIAKFAYREKLITLPASVKAMSSVFPGRNLHMTPNSRSEVLDKLKQAKDYID